MIKGLIFINIIKVLKLILRKNIVGNCKKEIKAILICFIEEGCDYELNSLYHENINI